MLSGGSEVPEDLLAAVALLQAVLPLLVKSGCVKSLGGGAKSLEWRAQPSSLRRKNGSPRSDLSQQRLFGHSARVVYNPLVSTQLPNDCRVSDWIS